MPLLAAWMLHLARQRCRSTNSKVDEMDKLAAVNAEVSSLTREAQESMCTADTLSLAHELAHTGNLYKAISKMIKHEHAKKTEKTGETSPPQVPEYSRSQHRCRLHGQQHGCALWGSARSNVSRGQGGCQNHQFSKNVL